MSERHLWLDDLRTLAVAGVIAFHAVISYGELGSWPYQDVAETHLAKVTEVLATLVFGPPSLFAMGLLFLVAGLLTPGSVDRKGPAAFARDRLARLGLPLLAVTLLWPALIALMLAAAGRPASYWEIARTSQLDNGPLWFVAVLLVFSLAYALWRALGRPDAPVPRLPLLMAAVGLGSFLVRLRFPVDSHQVANLHLWQWPECLGLFWLGLAGARRGWLERVPPGLGRRCGLAALVAVLALLGLLVAGAAAGVDSGAFGGGWGWLALATALLGGAVAVGGAVWALNLAERNFGQPSPWRARAARAAYGAFVAQAPVLIGLALAMRPLPLPAELKALLLAALAVPASFRLAELAQVRSAGWSRPGRRP